MGYKWPISITDDDAAEWVGEHRTEFVDLTALLLAVLKLDAVAEPSAEQWRGVLSGPARFIRKLGPWTAHVRVPGGEISDVVVKLDPPHTGGILGLAEQVRHSRAQRRYLWAHRLRALGIDTPRPLGFIERAHQPARVKSFAVSEYIFAPTLIEFRDDRVTAALKGNRDALLEKRAFITRVAGLLRDLHRHRIYARDLDGAGILVEGDTLVVASLGGLSRRHIFSSTAALEMTTALGRQLLDHPGMSTTDRMRFASTYFRFTSGKEAAQGLMRRLLEPPVVAHQAREPAPVA
jgi:hypothetical protein